MDLDNETERLKTFAHFPRSPVAPAALAAAGFIYTGESDRVRCVYDSCELERWEDGDDPMTEHGAKYPGCKFVTRRGTRKESEFRGQGEVVADACAIGPQRPSTAGVVPSERPPLESGGWGPQTGDSWMSVASRGPEESRSTVENESEAMMATDVMRMLIDRGYEEERLRRACHSFLLDGGLMPKAEMVIQSYWEIERCEGPSQKAVVTCALCTSPVGSTPFSPCGHVVCCDTCAAETDVCPQCGESVG